MSLEKPHQLRSVGWQLSSVLASFLLSVILPAKGPTREGWTGSEGDGGAAAGARTHGGGNKDTGFTATFIVKLCGSLGGGLVQCTGTETVTITPVQLSR